MGNESRLGRAALALVVIGAAAGCADLKGVNGNKTDCATNKTNTSTYDLPKGAELPLGGDDAGFGNHPKLTLVSDGNGDVTIKSYSSGSTGLDFQDGSLASIALRSDSNEPIIVRGDTIIFDGGKSDMDFSITVTPGGNGNTRLDVTATCPTS